LSYVHYNEGSGGYVLQAGTAKERGIHLGNMQCNHPITTQPVDD
jgi:hypothetical protein